MANWIKKINEARQAEKAYRDKGKMLWDKYSSATAGESKDVVNIFNPTTDIVLSALFNTTPKPDIRRRFSKKSEADEKKDALYRAMATVADYAVQYNFDRQAIREEFKSIFLDGFITGRGVGQLVYDYDTKQEQMADGYGQPVMLVKPVDQVFKVEHVEYQDFVQEKCRKQKNVTWQARVHLFTKKEIAEEFNISEEECEEMDFTYTLYSDNESDSVSAKYAQVWEIWDKSEMQRLYVCKSYKDGKPLRVEEDPLKLEGFFPFEIFKTVDNGKDAIPTAEYCIYEDLNKQLQRLNKRSIHLTNRSIKHVTVANGSDEALQSKIKNASDGDVVGVNQAPNLAAAQQVGAVPIAEAIAVKDKLDLDSQRIIDKIWEITGVSDIMRGSTQVGETATAQRQKGVFGTLRIQNRQKAVQGFIKNSFRKMSEAVCQFATIEELKSITCMELLTEQEKQELVMGVQMGSVQMTPQVEDALEQPTWEQVKGGLTDDRMRGYTIDIETTATVFDNVEEERKQIAELTSNVVGMLNTTAQLVAQSPSVMDLMEQLTLANLSTFKIGRSYTDSVKEIFVRVKDELSQPQQPNPVIEMQKQKEQADFAIKQQKQQLDAQKIALDAEYKNKVFELDRQIAAFNAANDSRNTDLKATEVGLKGVELQTQAYLEEQKIRKDIVTDANIRGSVADLV
ncbi:MAG: putative portal protein [Prokaryotic dsDNA virus sp.]|nr:MAG: putative portal protein [Prokaryotic dsDNA virus sp.]|tara:strand:+ start:12043 stop:14085 length:2043 start_codon:yes stop_codon:yes gene_type:complete